MTYLYGPWDGTNPTISRSYETEQRKMTNFQKMTWKWRKQFSSTWNGQNSLVRCSVIDLQP